MFHRWLCCLLIVLSVTVTAVQGEARSIRSFSEAEDQWPRLVGANWKLEGRYALIGDKTMKFVNCSMPFVFGSGVERPPGRFTNLEVTGTIERQDGKLVFMMDSIRAVPGDMQHLVIEKSRIDHNDPQDFYDLADWARQRAKFYNDAELESEAETLQRSGLEVEFQLLKPHDRHGLLALVRKAEQFQLKKSLIQEFLHDGYWDRFQYLQDRSPASSNNEYSELLVAISNDLEGARKPLDQYDANRSAAYLKQPETLYHAAKDSERAQFERLLYIHIATKKILGKADEQGKNGLQIADELLKEVPERQDVIEQYVDLGLKYESTKVAVMTRQEMLNLAQEFHNRQRPEDARRTKESWLKAREALYQDDGARGLVDLAEEWIQLLDDRTTAARYYIAAWKQNAQYPLAAAWLKQNGYALHEGNWIPEELVPPTQESAIEKAMREGRIETGMTTSQVKIAMGVAPDSLVRFATNGQVTEIWIYESARIMIRFKWSLGETSTVVEAISSMTSRAK